MEAGLKRRPVFAQMNNNIQFQNKTCANYHKKSSTTIFSSDNSSYFRLYKVFFN